MPDRDVSPGGDLGAEGLGSGADDPAGGGSSFASGPYAGRGPKAWSRSDARIREEVCERLLHDQLIDARGIEVAVQEGRVRLWGAVPGASDVNHAEMIARRTPGVTDVANELVLDPGRRQIDRSDREGPPQGQRTRWGKWVPPFTP